MGILNLMRIPCPTKFNLLSQIWRDAFLHPSRPTHFYFSVRHLNLFNNIENK